MAWRQSSSVVLHERRGGRDAGAVHQDVDAARAARASRNSARTSSGPATSARATGHRAPAPRLRAPRRPPRPGCARPRRRRAPAAARSRATARPMPRPPPVTSARRPWSAMTSFRSKRSRRPRQARRSCSELVPAARSRLSGRHRCTAQPSLRLAPAAEGLRPPSSAAIGSIYFRAEEARMLEPGTQAPDFEVQDHTGQDRCACRTTGARTSSCGSTRGPTPRVERRRVAGSATASSSTRTRACRSSGPASTPWRRTRSSRKKFEFNFPLLCDIDRKIGMAYGAADDAERGLGEADQLPDRQGREDPQGLPEGQRRRAPGGDPEGSLTFLREPLCFAGRPLRLTDPSGGKSSP